MNQSASAGAGAIPGLPFAETSRLLGVIQANQTVERVLLYGSRAMGRHRSGSDIDLCLEAPTMDLRQLLLLEAELDDLLLPWPIDLQIRHRIDHNGLESHISRAGTVLWERNQP